MGLEIPPDIDVPVFAAADLAARKDPAMAKAIEVVASTKAQQGRPGTSDGKKQSQDGTMKN